MGVIDLMNFPDDLFCSQILTRLPLKQAVRFSAVSRKWCRAWTQLLHLKFSDEFFESICTTHAKKRKAISKLIYPIMAEDIINKIILMQSAGLESFELHNCEKCENSIHKWLLWISSSGVKSINLKRIGINIEVSQSPFSCVTLRSLSLENFAATKVPEPFVGFPQLVTCHLESVHLSQKSFEAILKLCGSLQSLTVLECSLPSKLRVVSSSLKSLALLPLGVTMCSMEVNCPRLKSIEISECYGMEKMNICLPVCVHLEANFECLQHFVTVKSLRKIACFDIVIFTDFQYLQSFPCLKELYVDFTKFLSCKMFLAAEILRLPRLETLTMDIGLNDRDAISLCSYILKGAPRLKTIRVGMDYYTITSGAHGFDNALQIANAFLNLARGFPKTKISLSSGLINICSPILEIGNRKSYVVGYS